MSTHKIFYVHILVGIVLVGGILFYIQKNNVINGAATPAVTVAQESITVRVPVSEAMHPRVSPPNTPDGPHSNWYYSEPFSIPEDMMVSGFSIAMEDGTLDMLHHVSVVLLNRPATLCTEHFKANGGAYQLYSASRNTADPVELPAPYGMKLVAGDQLVVEFMEHTRAEPDSLYQVDQEIKPTLIVTLARDDTRSKDTKFARLRLDDTPCESPLPHQAFAVPVGEAPFVKQSLIEDAGSYITLTQDGVILISGANFWPLKGGQKITAHQNSSVLESFTATAGEYPWSWNIPHSYQQVPFSAGDVISVSAEYVNPFDEVVKDAAGMFGFYYSFE